MCHVTLDHVIIIKAADTISIATVKIDKGLWEIDVSINQQHSTIPAYREVVAWKVNIRPYLKSNHMYYSIML